MRRLALLVTALTACGPADRNGNGMGSGSDAAVQPTGDGPIVDNSQVYAHSGGVLYRIDTTTYEPVMIGAMAGLGTTSLTDLAIDKNNNMVGITLDSLYSIDSSNGTVTLVKDLSTSARGFTSLSYIPSDLNDPNSTDMLVSANDQGDVFSIDPATGDATKLGSYGSVADGKVISSGDLIGVRGLGIYATVNVGSAANDYLAKIDPTTWKATPLGTGTGFPNIFGLGFWAGKIYGFASGGQVLQIDANTGAGTVLKSSTVMWFGAGVSTDAPIIE